MASNNLVSTIQAFSQLGIHDGLSQSDRVKAHAQLVDTPEKMTTLIDTLYSRAASTTHVAFDLEGVNLSRHGSISLLQLWVLEQAFIVDIFTLGLQAFEIPGAEGGTLRDFLESHAIRKYFFDVRNDSDALFAHFQIRLAGVEDVQLLELASRRGPKKTLRGLQACIEQEKILTGSTLREWQGTKKTAVEMFDPLKGGSYEVWNIRPLSDLLIQYCVGDVRCLSKLADIYKTRLDRIWSERAAVETEVRLEESRSPDYKPRGKHRALGPKNWMGKHPSRSTTNSSTTTLSIENGLTPRHVVPQQHTVSEQHAPKTRRLGQSPLISSVPEGSQKKPKARAKQKHVAYSSYSQAESGVFNEEQNWAICDKDCGWCGHCADGLMI